VNLDLLRKARVQVETCLGLQSHEELLILTDGTIAPEIIDAFAAAGMIASPRVQVLQYNPGRFIAMREFGLFAGASIGRPDPALPRVVLSALAEADGVILLISDMPILFNEGFRSMVGQGKRVIGLPYITAESMSRLLPDTPEEAQALHALNEWAASRFRQASHARVVSEGGTDVRMEIGQFRINAASGVLNPEKGGRISLPAGQVSQVPNLATANGIVVIDRSIGAPVYKGLDQPIRLVIEAGRCVAIEGGEEARALRGFLQQLGHEGGYHFTELGIGTNHRCRHVGVAAPCEDTHTEGCVSFALGADVHLGGQTLGPCHIDMTMDRASLYLDDQPLILDGRLVR
jgi:2,5-dihydroxypyridine 5,6-dioxygenase